MQTLKKGRTWFFPSNVSDRYTVILGLDLKQSAKAIGTALISVLLAILFSVAQPFFL